MLWHARKDSIILTCHDYSEIKFYNTCKDNCSHYNKAGIAEQVSMNKLCIVNYACGGRKKE